MNKIVIVGGGAAGMMAGIQAARLGAEVTICEKNEKLGKKLFITGKGRCNVTNDCEIETLLDNVVTNPKFLYSSFYGFSSQATIRFFEELGVKLKVERGGRVFPVSDHSSDILRALEKELDRLNVKVMLNAPVEKVLTTSFHAGEADKTNKISGVMLKKGRVIEADKVLLATGGISYPLTGSTGEGHKIATDMGHGITALYPALVPLYTKENWCYSLMGLSLKNVSIVIKDGKKKLYENFGEMMFTHYGVSGPLILSASSYLTKRLAEEKKELVLLLDLKPALSEDVLEKRLLRDFAENQNKQFKNSLNKLFPSKLIPAMISLSGISAEKKVSEISKRERADFVTLIKNIPFTLIRTSDFREAVITQGGVSTREIDPGTMESKQIKNLYFAGEIIDTDALTGGFNLQIAWSNAYLAGNSMAKS